MLSPAFARAFGRGLDERVVSARSLVAELRYDATVATPEVFDFHRFTHCSRLELVGSSARSESWLDSRRYRPVSRLCWKGRFVLGHNHQSCNFSCCLYIGEYVDREDDLFAVCAATFIGVLFVT